MLTKIKFDKFTAFEKLEIKLSPGINVFLGENGTGKTHILKAGYAACDITKSQVRFADKVNNVFYPSGKKIGRLVKRSVGRGKGSLEVVRRLNGNGDGEKDLRLKLSISNQMKSANQARVSGATSSWLDAPLEAAYIPVKDMMANAPGFRSLYEDREIHFEEVYVDILRKAFLPPLRGPADNERGGLLASLRKEMDGRVIAKSEEFFLKNKQGELEFTLLSEGFRKLGLLSVLIQNGTLTNGSVLFWDEPETNLNPKIMRIVVEILMQLQRMGVQVLLATHDNVILKEFDLHTEPGDKVLYHSLYRDVENGGMNIARTGEFLKVSPNAIDDAYASLIDRELERAMGSKGR